MNARRMHACDDPHSFCARVESRVPKQTTNEISSIVRSHIEKDKTVSRVTKRCIKEVLVLREKRHAALLMKQGNDLRIFYAGKSKIASNLAERNVPPLQ